MSANAAAAPARRGVVSAIAPARRGGGGAAPSRGRFYGVTSHAEKKREWGPYATAREAALAAVQDEADHVLRRSGFKPRAVEAYLDVLESALADDVDWMKRSVQADVFDRLVKTSCALLREKSPPVACEAVVTKKPLLQDYEAEISQRLAAARAGGGDGAAAGEPARPSRPPQLADAGGPFYGVTVEVSEDGDENGRQTEFGPFPTRREAALAAVHEVLDYGIQVCKFQGVSAEPFFGVVEAALDVPSWRTERGEGKRFKKALGDAFHKCYEYGFGPHWEGVVEKPDHVWRVDGEAKLKALVAEGREARFRIKRENACQGLLVMLGAASLQPASRGQGRARAAASPARRFILSDGDHAMMGRVVRMLGP